MPKAKAKAKHNVSALSKAIRTHRHATPVPSDSSTVCLDFRSAAAATEFSAEDLGLTSGKRVPARESVKTVLASESSINVEHRIRNASVPLGCPVDDVAAVAEELSLEGFDSTRAIRRLMPKRPAWNFETSSGRLHHREVQAYKQWLEDVKQLIIERGGYPPAFEQNLQVWRQLWRVLERCHVVAIVVDVRHPLLHLPPALVYHVARTLRKPLLVVLNKLDMVDPGDAVRWAECLRGAVPGVAAVVGYSREPVDPEDFPGLPVGRSALIEACHSALATFEAAHGPAAPTTAAPLEEEKGDRIMLGLVGHPNVGKSSLVNSLMGGKVVSVKATPGHTKILQTMILDDRTCLCDSPGVVFPRLEVPREAQIVGMLIPLAQVREPFSAIRWVMERAVVPLNELLNLRPVTRQQVLDFHEAGVEVLRLDRDLADEQGDVPWSPMLLVAQYACQRGFVRGGRPDCTAAGHEILERVLEGRVAYSVRPPASWAPRSEPQAPVGGDVSDSDSDWQVEDGDYESEPEEDKANADRGLLEMFGVEARAPGSGSRKSRKKQEKKQQQRAAEAAKEAEEAKEA